MSERLRPFTELESNWPLPSVFGYDGRLSFDLEDGSLFT